MVLPLALLVIASHLGAIDAVGFHLLRFRLATQPGARAETLVHVLRVVPHALALVVLSAGTPSGRGYWALLAVFGAELVIDVLDVLLEPASRRALGGLPPLEYLLHITVAAGNGAVWASFAILGWPWRASETALVPTHVPTLLVWDARLLAAGAIALAGLELALLARSRRAVAELA